MKLSEPAWDFVVAAAYETGLRAGLRAGLERAAKECEEVGRAGKRDTITSWADNCAAAIRRLMEE